MNHKQQEQLRADGEFIGQYFGIVRYSCKVSDFRDYFVALAYTFVNYTTDLPSSILVYCGS